MMKSANTQENKGILLKIKAFEMWVKSIVLDNNVAIKLLCSKKSIYRRSDEHENSRKRYY
jgi:hypothetical protein